jgi:hypothetical protein
MNNHQLTIAAEIENIFLRVVSRNNRASPDTYRAIWDYALSRPNVMDISTYAYGDHVLITYHDMSVLCLDMRYGYLNAR